MKFCLLLAYLLVVAAAVADPGPGPDRVTADLYLTLRSIAFPDYKLTDNTLDGRFIMLTPGKILNFLDYYPGPEYTQFVNVSQLGI